MVSARRCGHARRIKLSAQKVGEGAARLEGARVLEHLKLESQGQGRELRQSNHGRAAKVRGNDRISLADLAAGDHGAVVLRSRVRSSAREPALRSMIFSRMARL